MDNLIGSKKEVEPKKTGMSQERKQSILNKLDNTFKFTNALKNSNSRLRGLNKLQLKNN